MQETETEMPPVVERLGLVNASAVLVARPFSPSVINRQWLTKNEIVTDEQLLQGSVQASVFADEMATVITPQFQLLVTQPQLQLTAGSPDHLGMIPTILGKVVRGFLSTTDYAAVGVNFLWQVAVNELHRSTEPLFGGNRHIFAFFADGDSHYGAYMSKNWNDFRLKLDVKPIVITQSMPGHEKINFFRIQMSFNFHHDLIEPDRPAEILRLIALWDDAFRYSSEISHVLQQECPE